MPFCSNCGSAVDGRFCAKCGTPVGAPAPPQPSASGSAALPSTTSTGLTDNLAGALCYLGLLITGILFLLIEPYSKNRAIRFHAFQAIFINVAWILVWFVINILFGIIHLTGLFVGLFLSPVIWLAFIVLWIYMIVSTYQGKTVVLPVVGQLAQQQA